MALLMGAAVMLQSCADKTASYDFPAIPVTYPATAQDSTVDTYFGQTVADPYRWLENDTSAQTEAWVKAQNEVTFGYLEKVPFRGHIQKELTERVNFERYSAPFKIGEYYFFYKNDGLQNQSVIYRQKGLEGAPEVFLDPNKLSADGTTSVGIVGASKDDKYLTLSVSKAGSDWQEFVVAEVATAAFLPDTLRWVKFSGATWFKDGFFYSRYDAPAQGTELSGQNQFHKVYYHKLGTPQDKDVLVYTDPKNPLRYFGLGQTEDETYQFLSVSQGTSGTELLWRKASAGNEPFKLLFKGFDHEYEVVDNIGDKLLVVTNEDAPNQKLVLVDPNKPEKANWTEFLAEKPEKINSVTTAGGKLFVSYLKDVATHVYQYDLGGKLEKEIPLPGLGSASGFSGKKDYTSIFYTYTSYNYPSTIFRYDIASGQSTVFRQPKLPINPEDFVVNQVFYPSKDGTKIPMFLIHRKDLKMDGQRPVYLYGYGGFNISLTPSYSAMLLYWAEQDGVIAITNLRGGGEYGEAWHKAGMLLNKQNVFDDFISAAEYLVKEKVTNKDKIAIAGGSNGGLLVGAAMTQRPDLFKVALPQVGVLDMLRYQKFTIGWGWGVEYGTSDSLQHFQNLIKYSPLHNLKAGTAYPATMVLTADHDDRVVPAHSFKFAAALQKAHQGENPVLIRIETQAGHGGSSLTKAIEERTDVYSFAFYNLKVVPKSWKPAEKE